jgi:hypothetical protein
MLSVANSTVGAEVERGAVLDVAARLLSEGLGRLDVSADSALIALRQALTLERQFGDDDERLCRACAAVCRALARVPGGLAEAVHPIMQSMDALDARAAATKYERDGSAEHREFLTRELLGLARRLAGGEGARVDELRAADRAFERLAQLAAAAPLALGADGLTLSPAELHFQQARTAQRIGGTLMGSSGAREQEAAAFYLHRALRKLRLAGLGERDARVREVRGLIGAAEAAVRASQQPASPPKGAAAAAAGDEEACVVQ